MRNWAICKQLDSLHVKNGEGLALCLNGFLVNKAWCMQEMFLSLTEHCQPFWVFLKCERMWKIRTQTWVLSLICPENSCSVLDWSFQTYQNKVLVSTRPFKEFKQSKLAHSYWAAPLELRPQLSNAHTIPVCNAAKVKLSREKKKVHSFCQTNAKFIKCKYPQCSHLTLRVSFPSVT